MNYHDYYKTLGVAKKATQDEIQKSYRKLARKFHPDINKDPETEGKFKDINEAYEVLKDPEKRQKYDQFGSAWKQAQRTGAPPAGYEDLFSQFGFGAGGAQGRSVRFDFGDLGGGRGARGGGVPGGGADGFSSFFETLFGGGGAPGAQSAWSAQPRQPQASRDYETKISLSIEEAGRGGKRQITVTDPATGKPRTLRVSIPKGIRPGQKIRLTGQGGEGGQGDRRGDLYLTVDILPHPDFRLEDSNLHTVIPVSPWEAALGGQATVRTLDGEVTVKIPAGSPSGRKVRLRGKGFPKKNGSNGDLLGEIRIVVPSELTPSDRELFEQLARESKFDPRSRN